MKTYGEISRTLIAIQAVLLLVQPSVLLAFQAAPVANTKNPTYITEKSAVVNGAMNPNETSDTYVWFEWGVSGRNTVYETTHRQNGSGSVLSDYSDTLYGLAPNVQYFYRLVAESSRGRDVGQTIYFTTKPIIEPIDPIVIVQTNAATDILEQTATLNGYIAPHEGKSVKWWFEYGTTNRLENTTATRSWGSDSGVAQQSPTNLTPGTTYLFRIVAENSQGIVYGVTRAFTTLGTAPLPSETARAQAISAPSAGDGVTRSGASGSGVASGHGAASASGTVIPGAAYYPTAAMNFPVINFGTIFGTKKTATNSAASGTVNPTNQVATAGAATPIGTFWNTLTGKKIAEVSIEKIGPSSAPEHTPVEYRVTYAYRRTDPATGAKLKIILPGSVVYIGDNTTNELLLEEGSGPERTYVLPVGRLESGSTRTISILGMTTSDAGRTFPDARARLEYTLATGGVEVVSAEGTAAAASVSAKPTSSFSLFPNSFFGWLLYILVITLIIFGVRKARSYYVAKKNQLAMEEESQRREHEAKQLPNDAVPA